MNLFDNNNKSEKKLNLNETLFKSLLYKNYISSFLHDINKDLRIARRTLKDILNGDIGLDVQTKLKLKNLQESIDSICAQHISLHEFGQQQMDSKRHHLNLNFLADSAIQRLKMIADSKNIKFEYAYSDDCTIFCNEDEIIMAIINIIINAIESINLNSNHCKIIIITQQSSKHQGPILEIIKVHRINAYFNR